MSFKLLACMEARERERSCVTAKYNVSAKGQTLFHPALFGSSALSGRSEGILLMLSYDATRLKLSFKMLHQITHVNAQILPNQTFNLGFWRFLRRALLAIAREDFLNYYYWFEIDLHHDACQFSMSQFCSRERSFSVILYQYAFVFVYENEARLLTLKHTYLIFPGRDYKTS